MSACSVCHCNEELRPYGAGGALICFDCMMATPETQTTAEQQFAMALDAAASTDAMIVVIGGESGPYPLGGNRQ